MTATPAGADRPWALARLAFALAEGFLGGWRALPSDVRRRFVRAVLLGLAVCLAASAAAVVVARGLAERGALGWEEPMLRRLDAGSFPLSYHSAVWIGAFGSTAMLVPVVFVAAFLLALRRRTPEAVAVLAAYFLAKPVILLGWWMWDRARPDFIAEGIAVPLALNSFPSGHVLQGTAVYGVLTLLWARASGSRAERALAWSLFAAFAAVQAVARARIGAHWPSDIVAGLALGVMLAAALGAALRVVRASEAGLRAPPRVG